MKQWVRYLLIGIFLLMVSLALIFLPISNYLDFLQGWDSAFTILTFLGTVIFGILTWKSREKEQIVKTEMKQDIEDSSVHGDAVGPNASNRNLTVNKNPTVQL